MEQHFAPALSALCQKNIIILEVRSDARDMSTIVHSSLQSLIAPYLTSPLPKFEFQAHVHRVRRDVVRAVQDGRVVENPVCSSSITTLEYDAELTQECIVTFLRAVLHRHRKGALLVRPAHNKVGHVCRLTIGIRDLLNSHPEHGSEDLGACRQILSLNAIPCA